MRIVLGVLLASVASLLFNGAILLQARETRAVSSAHGLRASLLGRLLQRRRWLAGGALQVAGAALQTAALLLAPLTSVQPAEAIGLLLLIFLASRTLGEHVGRREIVAVCLIVAGVAGVTAFAPHRKIADLDASGAWIAVSVLGAAALAPYALRRWRDAGSWLTVIGAGAAFALSAFCSKLLADALDTQAWGITPIAAATAVIGAVTGLLSEQSSLQRRPATQVAPVIFIIELLVPIALGVTVIDESWSRSPAAIAVCLSLVTVGTVILTRTPTVAQLAATTEPE
jgi:drug/metabolite transporter (DMT)-like permease